MLIYPVRTFDNIPDNIPDNMSDNISDNTRYSTRYITSKVLRKLVAYSYYKAERNHCKARFQ